MEIKEKKIVKNKSAVAAKRKIAKKKKTKTWGVDIDVIWKSMEFAKKHPIEFAEGW